MKLDNPSDLGPWIRYEDLHENTRHSNYYTNTEKNS